MPLVRAFLDPDRDLDFIYKLDLFEFDLLPVFDELSPEEDDELLDEEDLLLLLFSALRCCFKALTFYLIS